MFRFVDTIDSIDDFEGFAFTNMDGGCSKVWVDQFETIALFDTVGDAESEYAVEDIPKLIKALQAAYDYKTKGDK